MRRISATLAAIGLLAAGSPVRADLVKCQAAIEKNTQKLQAAILKELTKCKDGYRKALATNTVGIAAVACQGGLFKTADFGNPVSAIQKTKAALDKLTLPSAIVCTDSDLGALGHLGVGLFGDRWARLLLLSALKGAWDQQALLVGDFVNVLRDLGNNGCPLCEDLETPPCRNTVCSLGGMTGAETKVVTVPLPVPITGATVLGICEWQNVLPNELGLIGTANLGLQPTVVGGSTICNLAIRSMGITACSGSTAPQVSYTSCQDSLLGGADTQGTTNECDTGGATCQANPNASTGGSCATFTTAASVEGDTFILSGTRLLQSTAVGPDGEACTPDDTYLDSVSNSLPATTGTASATVLDYNNTDGSAVSEGPASGAVGSGGCAAARAGSSSGLKVIAAFPGADIVGSPLMDTVTRVTLECN